jgi:hypothetical protein
MALKIKNEDVEKILEEIMAITNLTGSGLSG